MLKKATAAQEVMRRLRKMQAGDSLELLTWKKDRSLLLVKQSSEEVVVVERGFVEDEYRIEFRKLKKLLKTLLKREFPRSHKIRKRGAPKGHPGWFHRKPDHIDQIVHVSASTECPHCSYSTLAPVEEGRNPSPETTFPGS